MDESALRSALARLDDCGALLHSGLKVATALVVIGVALEMVFVIWEYLEDLHDFKRGLVHPPDKPSWVLFALGFLGAALVALGVSGELYAESKIATLETCIRKGNDTLSLLLSKEAGDAKVSAAGAAASASAAKADAKTARADSESAKTTAHDARQQADAVAKQAETLKGELIHAEQSLINLAICNAPRVITPWTLYGTRDNRFDSLAPFSTTKAMIEFIPDFEARRAALYTKLALSKAGWTISEFTPKADIVEDGVDVQVFVPPGSRDQKERDSQTEAKHRSEEAAAAIIKFLHSYNWQARQGYPGDDKRMLDTSIIPPGALRIRIGLYPAAVYVTPPGDKELAAAEAEKTKQSKDSLKQWRENFDRDRLKGLTGKEAADMKAKIEQWRVDHFGPNDEAFFTFSGDDPCRPLNSVGP